MRKKREIIHSTPMFALAAKGKMNCFYNFVTNKEEQINESNSLTLDHIKLARTTAVGIRDTYLTAEYEVIQLKVFKIQHGQLVCTYKYPSFWQIDLQQQAAYAK